MQTNYSPPSTPSNIFEKLKHYRKSQMSSVLRNLLNSPPSRPTTMSKPQSKLQSFSQRTSPLPKDLSGFERTQDQTVKHLDFSHLHEFEIRTPNMTPHSPLNSKNQMSRVINLYDSFSRNKNQILSLIHKGIARMTRDTISFYFLKRILQSFRIYQNKIKLKNITSSIIRRKDVERIVNLFQTPMVLAQQENLTETFSEMILFLATFFMDCQEYSKATFFLKDCYTLSNLTRNPLLKVKILLALAQCAKQYKLFDQQILIVQKALMYTWAFDYHDLEIQCYDAMGISYFYQGNIQRAEFYHQKWTSGFLESPKSYYRITALEFISMFEKTLPTKAIDFMSSIQGSISIPFINIANGKYYDDKRFIKYRLNFILQLYTIIAILLKFLQLLWQLKNSKNLIQFIMNRHKQQIQLIRDNQNFPKEYLKQQKNIIKTKNYMSLTIKSMIIQNTNYPYNSRQIIEQHNHFHCNMSIQIFLSLLQLKENHLSKHNKEFIPAFVARYKKMLLQILK